MLNGNTFTIDEEGNMLAAEAGFSDIPFHTQISKFAYQEDLDFQRADIPRRTDALRFSLSIF